MIDDKNKDIQWFCQTCNDNAITTIKMIQELKIENEKTNKAVASLSNKLILLKKSYSDIVKRLAELEKLKSHTVPTNNVNTNETTSELEKRIESFEQCAGSRKR